MALRHLLLLTATITPSEGKGITLRSDPKQRLGDYLQAMKAYLTLPPGGPDALLFCENSASDLTQLRALAETDNPYGRQVSFLSYRSDMPPERGKGCAELDILDRAYDDVLDGRSDVLVWKVTGRLQVTNLQAMIAGTPERAQLYGDFRSVPLIGEALGGNDWLDTRLLAYTPEYYRRYLYGKKDRCGYCIEKSLFAAIRPSVDSDSGIVPRFRTQPQFRGICAGSNEDYEDFPARAKTAIRSTGRRVAPWLWI